MEWKTQFNNPLYSDDNLANLITLEKLYKSPDVIQANSSIVDLACKHYQKYERNFMVRIVAQDILLRFLSAKVSDSKSINAALSIARKLESQHEAVYGPKITTSTKYELDILSTLNWMCLRPNRVTLFGALCDATRPGKHVFFHGIELFENTFNDTSLSRFSTLHLAITVLALSCLNYRVRVHLPKWVDLGPWRASARYILERLEQNRKRKNILGLCQFALCSPQMYGRKKKNKIVKIWQSIPKIHG